MSRYMILIWTVFSGMRYENLEKHWKNLLQQLKKTLKKIAKDLRVLLTYSHTTGSGTGTGTGTGSGTGTCSGSCSGSGGGTGTDTGTATNHGTVCTRNNSFQTQSKRCLKQIEYFARILRTSSNSVT